MNHIEAVDAFCKENGLSLRLSHDMPPGYETAYGTYDVSLNTLFLNIALLRDTPEREVLFYLFHELRHAMQYLQPALFDEQIQESRFYVILYNGTCFKLTGNEWKECSIEGGEDYFTAAYLSLPYELDANSFAYEKVKALCGDSAELRNLYDAWTPGELMEYEEHRKLFRRLDAELFANRQEKLKKE